MNRILKKASLFAVSALVMLSLSVPAFAANNNSNTSTTQKTGVAAVDNAAAAEAYIKSTVTTDSSGNIKYSSGTVKTYLRETPDGTYSKSVDIGNGKMVYYNTSSAATLSKLADKVAANGKVGEKVNDITNGMTVEANTSAATMMLSGFKPILELAVGLIAVLITFGMTLFSSLDICYIAFPVFRNKCEDAKQSGNSAMTKKSANGDVQLRWITDDAQYAVTQGTIDSGKSPWALYFKKRIASYIFLGIIVFILLTGNITVITDLAINVVAGIIDILTSLS